MTRPKLIDLAVLVANYGHDPHTVNLEQVLSAILRDAQLWRGRAMAAVKLNKGQHLVTIAEAVAALQDPMDSDDDLSIRAWRAGEIEYQAVMAERGLYDPQLATQRADTNIALDDGELTRFARKSPTGKRPSGRPASRIRFIKMLARDVYFRLGGGEASSVEKVLEQMTGRNRNGEAIARIVPTIVLPIGKKSHRTLTGMIEEAARIAPDLIAEARRQGEISLDGSDADPEFYSELTQGRAIFASPDAVRSMLRIIRREK